jgi:MFS family permease
VDEASPSVPDSAAAAVAPEFAEPTAEARRTVRLLMAMLAYVGYATAIPAIASPWIAKSFALSESQVAGVFAWLALASLGALALARMVDRLGRRRVLMWSTVAMPVCALGAALSPQLALFVAFEIVLSAFAGAAAASAIVMIAETLPIPRRAQGQSLGGLATVLGSGVTVLLMPALVRFEFSWRWLLVLAAVGLAMLPQLARAIPESARWAHEVDVGGAAPTRFYDVFVPLYRRRSIVLVVCSILAALSAEGVSSYTYFHAVSVVKLSADAASAITLFGGGLGMFGFPIGAWTCERFGRVPTIVVFGIATSALALGYYWGPPAHFAHPAVWLAIAFLLTTVSTNATTVASNAAVTELFPTALRGTMIGWFALTSAGGSLAAEVTIATLASRMGGLSMVTGWLSLLGIPAAMLFGVMIQETRGLSLDESASEDAFRASRRAH